MRRHWLPLDRWQKKFAVTGTGVERRLESRPEVVMNGRKGEQDAISAVRRRLVEAAQAGSRTPALFPSKRASARLTDLAQLLAGEVDLDRTMRLARGLLALDRRQWRARPKALASSKGGMFPDDAWIAIRLSCLPFPLPPEEHSIPFDPAILRRLESGDAASAGELALRHLHTAGIRPTIRAVAASPETARLWAAALAFPIHSKTALAFMARIDPNNIKEEDS